MGRPATTPGIAGAIGTGTTVVPTLDPGVTACDVAAPAGNEFPGCGGCELLFGEGGDCVLPTLLWANADPAARLKTAADSNKVLRINVSKTK